MGGGLVVLELIVGNITDRLLHHARTRRIQRLAIAQPILELARIAVIGVARIVGIDEVVAGEFVGVGLDAHGLHLGIAQRNAQMMGIEIMPFPDEDFAFHRQCSAAPPS